MATRASNRLFLSLFLSLFICCSSGTLAGFSYHAKGSTISLHKDINVSPAQIRVFVSDHKVLTSLFNTGVFVDLYVNQSQLQTLTKSKSSGVTWLKTHVISFLPHVNIKSIVACIGKNPSRHNDLARLLSTLKSVQSLLSSFRLDNQVKVSVAFPLSFFKNLSEIHERHLCRIFSYIKEVKSYIIVEEVVNMGGDRFVQSVIQKANFAISIIPCNDVPMVLTIKSPSIPSPKEVSEFSDKVSKALQNNTRITTNMVAVYVEVPTSTSQRQLLTKTTQHDTTVFPITPITNTPTTPTIVTVNPSPNPVTIGPANPDTPVVTLPLTTPPVTNPVTTPITVPGAQPVTNPVNPTPSGNVPTTAPVTTNPGAPPASNNIPGQSWCVAKSGAPETAIQAALDYACGGGADCSQIQQGGSCYNPNNLQNHASYAFNSYYQKNPLPTSCDFGGTATLVNANPSTGSCIYQTSSSSSTTVSPSSTTPVTPTPVTPTPSTPTASIPTPSTPTVTNPAAPAWGAVSGSGTPTVLNTSTGTTPDFGLESPPGFTNSSTSKAAGLRPFIGFIFLVISLVTRKTTLHM
ncbi:glucan endo-1,3-beta-glucosidase 3 isoform X1 [Morus notabilis]|uniref:glucan endo-1,3-beta-glucosidase 3 isoform X1 n=1 Tax=Morus notabilis TaxID=981085 RepID=UPI000CED5557|nr:glucan endo-1,3-beta-glucosidase 3 isoform X1 [Morus notabilis]